MSNAQHDHWLDEDDTMESPLEFPPTGNRRAMLGAAAGFALAASGLLLPDWHLEEAEAADQHPVRNVQQRKEQRRKKQRNERNRKTHGRRDRDADKQHGRPDAPQLGPHGIKLTVENQTSSDFKIKYWYGSVGWSSQEGNLPSQGTFFTGTEDLHAGIEFLTERLPFVWVENPVADTPNTTYQYGGSMSFIGYTGGSIDVNHGTLEEGAETTHRIPFTNSSTFSIKVRRERDIPRSRPSR